MPDKTLNNELCSTCGGPCISTDTPWDGSGKQPETTHRSLHDTLVKRAVDEAVEPLKEIILDMYSQFGNQDSLSAVQICEYELKKRGWIPNAIPKDGE